MALCHLGREGLPNSAVYASHRMDALLWRRDLHHPLRQADDVLDQRGDHHEARGQVADGGTETERPDYAPGVNQPRSDDHANEGSDRSQDLLRHPTPPLPLIVGCRWDEG
jgi:hypothetical protein